MKLGFFGGGNLAASMIRGLRARDASGEILVHDISAERLEYLRSAFAIRPAPAAVVAAEADVLLLLVKPHQVAALLEELRAYDLSGKLLLSTAAGVPLHAYTSRLPGMAPVRAMPNTSAAVLRAVTGLAAGAGVTPAQRESAAAIFSALGKVVWVEEAEMNALTALSGSGPAYFYLLTELLAAAGAELGLAPATAEFLARETLVGAGRVLEAGEESPALLRERVSSPGGVTLAALDSLGADGLGGAVLRALRAGAARAAEMEREYGARVCGKNS
ncbi:MAG: pyrroline-5-carboxylate reductase [Gracilibacteraceae bacterium]|nr:pyrroline-5-carboxylate reductase [Gracilibacteraceae bacterium]